MSVLYPLWCVNLALLHNWKLTEHVRRPIVESVHFSWQAWSNWYLWSAWRRVASFEAGSIHHRKHQMVVCAGELCQNLCGVCSQGMSRSKAWKRQVVVSHFVFLENCLCCKCGFQTCCKVSKLAFYKMVCSKMYQLNSCYIPQVGSGRPRFWTTWQMLGQLLVKSRAQTVQRPRCVKTTKIGCCGFPHSVFWWLKLSCGRVKCKMLWKSKMCNNFQHWGTNTISFLFRWTSYFYRQKAKQQHWSDFVSCVKKNPEPWPRASVHWSPSSRNLVFCRLEFASRTEQYTRIVQDKTNETLGAKEELRMRQLMALLVNQSIHHRDLIDGKFEFDLLPPVCGRKCLQLRSNLQVMSF